MSKPAKIEFETLVKEVDGRTTVWTLPFLSDRVRSRFECPIVSFPDQPESAPEHLIVIGGGELMDYAKIWRVENASGTRLTAIPSLWGSGAENSPVAILNREGEKVIHMGPEFLPDRRSIWPDLAEGLPEEFVRYACGDTWAHALEGFLSPLGNGELRAELGDVIKELCEMPVANDPRWFELSAQSCAGQAKSSVGLIHGIAHTLEPLLRDSMPSDLFGHARLCSTFALPVFRYNLSASEKPARLLQEQGIDLEAIERKLSEVFAASDFETLLPAVEEHWRSILRNPSSRTNSALVRMDDFEKLKAAVDL